MSQRIEFKVSVPVRVRKQDDVFVAACPALDVVSQGDSHDDALENLVRAIQLFLTTCYETGTLDDVLRDSGFEPTSFPRRGEYAGETVDVPLHLLSRRRHAENHAG